MNAVAMSPDGRRRPLRVLGSYLRLWDVRARSRKYRSFTVSYCPRLFAVFKKCSLY